MIVKYVEMSEDIKSINMKRKDALLKLVSVKRKLKDISTALVEDTENVILLN